MSTRQRTGVRSAVRHRFVDERTQRFAGCGF
jgi:hypothetical protein